MNNFVKSQSSFGLSVIALLVCLLTGCEKQLQTGYGRAYGSNYSGSVNGTAVLQEMVKAAGHKVDRYGKISPRWDDYNTVYWIPDQFNAPRDEAIEKIEGWLESDWHRTLVFVARDYDAAMIYWEYLKKKENVKGSQNEREFADAITNHLMQKNFNQENDCNWFEWSDHPFQKAKKITGSLTSGIDASKADVYYGSLPIPGEIDDDGSFNNYDVEVLLNADSIPLVFSLTRSDWSGSRIIIVGNGSFLLNLPLANQENRKLANNLIHKTNEADNQKQEVLFVESRGKIPVSDNDAPDSFSKWGWITKQPLRYIVPNILFWCMLFCFVYFPIFGRPRKIKHRSNANFHDHINALANLLRRTKSREKPKTWIEDYRRRTSRIRKSGVE